MKADDIVKTLNTISSSLHDCSRESFSGQEEVEAWGMACEAIDRLRCLVVERLQTTTPSILRRVERRGLLSRLIGRS
jgi:hypothetical protein